MPYPGTAQHQRLLQAVVSHYADDPRILAVVVFGSLGRGTWDEYSDLDLDVVLADGVRLHAMEELEKLCETFVPLGEHALLFDPDGEEEGDVVLGSLMGLSVRYHPLHNTSPNIVDSLVLLTGRIDAETIKAAGWANRQDGDTQTAAALAYGVNRYLRLAVNADIALQRHHFWRALQLLQFMREAVLGVFAQMRGGDRPYHIFQAEADERLQAALGQTLPQHSLRSAQQCLLRLLDLAEHDLPWLTGGHLHLSETHREVIAAIRARQATLDLPD